VQTWTLPPPSTSPPAVAVPHDLARPLWLPPVSRIPPPWPSTPPPFPSLALTSPRLQTSKRRPLRQGVVPFPLNFGFCPVRLPPQANLRNGAFPGRPLLDDGLLLPFFPPTVFFKEISLPPSERPPQRLAEPFWDQHLGHPDLQNPPLPSRFPPLPSAAFATTAGNFAANFRKTDNLSPALLLGRFLGLIDRFGQPPPPLRRTAPNRSQPCMITLRPRSDSRSHATGPPPPPLGVVFFDQCHSRFAWLPPRGRIFGVFPTFFFPPESAGGGVREAIFFSAGGWAGGWSFFYFLRLGNRLLGEQAFFFQRQRTF